MLELLLIILLIIVSLMILVKGADLLVKGASDFATWLKVSPILVGLTVVAFGTSLPEFIVSLFSVLAGNADISIGNIVGSNIANIALVIGICATLTVLKVKSKTLTHEFPFLIISSFLLLILGSNYFIFQQNTSSLGRIDGIILIIMFGLFLFYIFKSMRKQQKKSVKKEFRAEIKHTNSLQKNIFFMVLGVAGLVIGGKLFTTYASKLAQSIGASDAFIGLTIAALGTSLPELAASGVAAWKGHGDLAIGNIVGSNIFNVLFVLGTVSLIKPISINPAVLAIDGIVMLFVTLLFLLFATTGKKVNRWEGAALLACYIAYFAFVVIRL